MAQGDIIQSEDGRRYRLGPYLKAGLLGIVYLATDAENGEHAAVKLPQPRLGRDQRARFQIEAVVLKAIWNASAGRRPAVPWVRAGTVPAEPPAEPVSGYVLEFVGEERLLSRQLPGISAPGLARERMALEAAQEYARLLQTLHKLNYTCQDRKLADVRWRSEEGGLGDSRLVVLDWNVVEQGSEKQLDDLYLFGLLWYQLLSGRYAAVPLNVLDDSLWADGSVSLATRRLLAAVLAPARTDRPQSATILEQAIDRVLGLLGRPAAELAAEGREQAAALLSPHYREQVPELEREWQALSLLDLAERLGVPTQETAGLRELAHDQGRRLVGRVRNAFLLTQYDDAEEGLRQAEGILAQSRQLAAEQRNPQLALQVGRWRALVRAGQAALVEGQRLRPVRDRLARHVEQMESIAQGQSSPDRLAATWRRELSQTMAEARLPADSQTANLIGELDHEFSLYQALEEGRRRQEEGDYIGAGQALEQATSALAKISVYRSELEAIVGDLAIRRQALEQKADWQRRLALWDEKTRLDRSGAAQ